MVFKGRLHMTPRPASRPRFTCRGRFAVAYTDKPYRQWLDEAANLMKDRPMPEGWDTAAPMSVTLTFAVPKPKTSKLTYPKPDIDNYEKSFLDAVTQAGTVWDDDTQVVTLRSTKLFVDDLADAGVLFSITPVEIA